MRILKSLYGLLLSLLFIFYIIEKKDILLFGLYHPIETWNYDLEPASFRLFASSCANQPLQTWGILKSWYELNNSQNTRALQILASGNADTCEDLQGLLDQIEDSLHHGGKFYSYIYKNGFENGVLVLHNGTILFKMTVSAGSEGQGKVFSDWKAILATIGVWSKSLAESMEPGAMKQWDRPLDHDQREKDATP